MVLVIVGSRGGGSSGDTGWTGRPRRTHRCRQIVSAGVDRHRSRLNTRAMPAPETGYAPVDDLRMYYEIHGSGGTPLLLLHGGLFDIEQQFGALIPGLAETRQVIATDFQGHGRTNDVNRPLRSADLASDV